MNIGANGIVINEYGDVLLVRRDDTRTFAPPGGACEKDELPIDTTVREVQEETGLSVFPIRLTGLYFLPVQPEPFLFLYYRCIPRSGNISNSSETLQTGFFKTDPLPNPMLSFHQEELKQAYDHKGGPPNWSTVQVGLRMRAGIFLLNRLVYPWLEFHRSRQGLPPYVPPTQWQVRATLVLNDAKGRVLLVQPDNTDDWMLPSSDFTTIEPPWTLGNKLVHEHLDGSANINNLSGIYMRKGEPEMEFVFSGTVQDGAQILTGKNTYFETDSFPQNLAADHRVMIENYLDPSEEISYKLFDEPAIQ